MSAFDSSYSAESSISLPAISSVTAVNAAVTGLASRTLSWTAPTYADKYIITLDGTQISDVYGQTSYSAEKLNQGQHSFSVIAYNSANRTFDSASFSTTFSLPVIPTATGLSFNRSVINGGTLTWVAPTYANQYDVYDGDTLVKSGVTTNQYAFTGLTQGAHTF